MPRQSAYLSEPEKAYVEYRADDWGCSQGEVIKRLIRRDWYGELPTSRGRSACGSSHDPPDRTDPAIRMDSPDIVGRLDMIQDLITILGRSSGVDVERELASMRVESLPMPGHERYVDDRRNAVLAMWEFLRDRREASPRAFVDALHDEHAAGYGNAETWWRNLSDVLIKIDSVERASQRRYVYVGGRRGT